MDSSDIQIINGINVKRLKFNTNNIRVRTIIPIKNNYSKIKIEFNKNPEESENSYMYFYTWLYDIVNNEIGIISNSTNRNMAESVLTVPTDGIRNYLGIVILNSDGTKEITIEEARSTLKVYGLNDYPATEVKTNVLSLIQSEIDELNLNTRVFAKYKNYEENKYYLVNDRSQITIGVLRDAVVGQNDYNYNNTYVNRAYTDMYPFKDGIYLLKTFDNVDPEHNLMICYQIFDEDKNFLYQSNYIGRSIEPGNPFKMFQIINTADKKQNIAYIQFQFNLENFVENYNEIIENYSFEFINLYEYNDKLEFNNENVLLSSNYMQDYGYKELSKAKIVPLTTNNGKIMSYPFKLSKGTNFTLTNNSKYKIQILFYTEDWYEIGWTYGGKPIVGPNINYTIAAGYSISDAAYITITVFTNEFNESKDDIDWDNLTNDSFLSISYDQQESSTTITPARLRIMEYNIGHYSYGVSPTGLNPETADEFIQSTKELFTAYRPDILFVEEWQDKLINDDSGTSACTVLYDPIWSFTTNRTGGWNMIRSIFPINNIKSSYILPSPPYTNSKPYQYGEIFINGHTVSLCCIHFLAVYPENGEFNNIVEARYYEMEQTLEFLKDKEYVILAGDFNSDKSGEPESMFGLAEEYGYTIANGGYLGYKNTWSYKNPTVRIDNILVKGDIKISNFEVLYDWTTKLPGDHIPLIVDIIVY